MTRRLLPIVFAIFVLAAAPPRAEPAPIVLAASSLQEALTAAADAWVRTGHRRPILAFGASSALARQAMAGAPADLFVSADTEWMDAIEHAGLLVPGTRRNLLGNQLVVVARRGTIGRLRNRAEILRTLTAGPLAMADPDSVPAGRYGKAALTTLGVWDRLAPRIVRAENVRAALALVERGVAPFGVVYATDARAAPTLRVAGRFPAHSHPPILYPLARLRGPASREAEAFRTFLLGRSAREVFHRYGFGVH